MSNCTNSTSYRSLVVALVDKVTREHVPKRRTPLGSSYKPSCKVGPSRNSGNKSPTTTSLVESPGKSSVDTLVVVVEPMVDGHNTTPYNDLL